MICKLCLFCIGLLPVLLHAQCEVGKVTLKGQLIHFNNQTEVQDLSEMQYLNTPSAGRMITPDSTGRFEITFNLNCSNYFRLGRNILYLSPGDDMEVVVDQEDPKSSTFKGIGAAMNRYLRETPYPKGGSFLKSGDNLQKTVQATIDTVRQIADVRLAKLTKLNGVTKEFKRLEAARIRAGVINSLLNIPGYGPYILQLKGKEAENYRKNAKALYQPVIEKYAQGFMDTTFMKIEVYRDISGELADINRETGKDLAYIRDWQTAVKLTRQMNRQNDKDSLKAFQADIDKLSVEKFRTAASRYLSALTAFGKGDSAEDFIATDMNGRPIKLSSLKGKVIYIDLWATWCGPCMKEMPRFEELKAHFKNDSSVAFVSLSIDDNEDGWKNSVNSRHAKGRQWLINREKLSAYHIVGIPRVLLIDKNFKMAEMNGPLPSDKQVTQKIESLL